jgi:hypothetical protein
MKAVWREAEKKFVADNAPTMKDSDLAAALCRLTGRLVTKNAVRDARRKLGIKKKQGRPRRGMSPAVDRNGGAVERKAPTPPAPEHCTPEADV